MSFVDSSFWIAAWMPSEDRHGDAVRLLERHGGDALITSNHVRGETWTFMRKRYGHRASTEFLRMLEQSPRLEVAFVGEELEREALDWLRRHDEREYSFVDATSFALMRARRIDRALAFDGDFAAAGFEESRA